MAVQGAELSPDVFDVFGDSGLVPGGVKAEDRLVDLFLGEGLATVQGRYSQMAYSPRVSFTGCSPQ